MSVRPPFAVTLARRVPILAVLTSALLLGACANGGSIDLLGGAVATNTPEPAATNPIKTAGTEKTEARTELQKATEYWGKQAAERPNDPRAAVNYAKNLKALGAKKEALGVLQEASRENATDRELLSEYGRLALELDQISNAQILLEKADDPVRPDWKVVSARGTVMAKLGRHEEAIQFFERARELAPEQGTVLNNLAMAYAMNGEAAKAEMLLRDAQAKNPDDRRFTHNLALVLGLQGKHGEAEKLSSGSTDTVAQNADVMRQIVGKSPDAEPVMPVMAAEPKPAPTKAASKGSKAATMPTASTTPAKGAKAKGKTAEPDIDTAELVRRLADGGEAPKTK
jgi:Flp pilus assembly protein TadD